jgi:hypothetical protein
MVKIKFYLDQKTSPRVLRDLFCVFAIKSYIVSLYYFGIILCTKRKTIELTSLLPVTSCIIGSTAIYIMVAKFRNTICPPPLSTAAPS